MVGNNKPLESMSTCLRSFLADSGCLGLALELSCGFPCKVSRSALTCSDLHAAVSEAFCRALEDARVGALQREVTVALTLESRLVEHDVESFVHVFFLLCALIGSLLVDNFCCE